MRIKAIFTPDCTALPVISAFLKILVVVFVVVVINIIPVNCQSSDKYRKIQKELRTPTFQRYHSFYLTKFFSLQNRNLKFHGFLYSSPQIAN